MGSMILCFGGPMDGQMAVDYGHVMLAAMSAKPSAFLSHEPPSPIGIAPRLVSYSLQRFAHPQMDDDWAVYVADGYPMHRIADQMNAIVGLCRLAAGQVDWGLPA